MNRFVRRSILLSIVGIVGLAGAPTPVRAAAETPEAAAQAPIRFGAAQAATSGLSKIQAIQALEGVIGRPLAVVRTYDRWNTAFPDATDTWLKSTGHTLFLSIKTRRADGSYLKWSAIAAAEPGSALYKDMVRWADAIKAYAVPVYVSFNHEPETSVSHPSGTAADYVRAWHRFVEVFRARGVTNARFAWVAAIRNYSVSQTSYKYAPRYYPGDGWVDVLAIDAYNTYCPKKNGTFTDPWRTLETILGPFMTFAATHPTLELVVAEFGSAEDPAQPGRKAQWIDQARLLFQKPAYERFRVVLYWNQVNGNNPPCDFRVTTGVPARDAFKAMAQDPYYSAP